MNTRTNIVIDDKLMKSAMKAAGAKTKREAVEIALRDLANKGKRKNVLDLVGKGLIDPDYDVRVARSEGRHGSR